MDRALLLTGATGFVGSHFLDRALREGLTVYCLTRGSTPAEARRRVLAARRTAAESYPERGAAAIDVPHLHVVTGDVTAHGCGLLPAERAALRSRPLEVWHFAASLSFEERARDAIDRANVDGTRHALALALELDAARFVYLSTAYTAGRADGEIAERLHPIDGPFNNHYERSKCRAEHEVMAWAREHGREACIARPSIVVGPEHSALPGGSSTGLYGFVRELFRMRHTLAAVSSPLVLLGDPDAPLDLVPVDWVAAELLALRRAGFPGGPIHHLTSGGCPSVGRAVAAAADAAGAPSMRVAARRAAADGPLERALDRRTSFYGSYLVGRRHFARAAGPGPVVSDAQVDRYCRAYAAELRAADPLSLFAPQMLRASDGARLQTFAAGRRDAPAVVLVNAYGMGPEIMVPLAERLAARHRVITWEARGLHASHPTDGAGALGIARHVRDLQQILAHYAIERAHLVGFCTGADVALAFASALPARTASLTSLNGSLLRSGAAETRFQQQLRAVVSSASRSLEHARFYHQALYGDGGPPGRDSGPARAEAQDRFARLLGEVDPELLHLTSRPFLTPEALHRYALAMDAFFTAGGASWPERALGMPVLVITAAGDRITNPEASRAFALRARAELIELEGADHFAHVRKPEVAEAIARSIASSLRLRSGPQAYPPSAPSLRTAR
jgi:nucleoside-diphosphate-sugar epimerase/pimeloyl-ACP methyl ester carboxylesterase